MTRGILFCDKGKLLSRFTAGGQSARLLLGIYTISSPKISQHRHVGSIIIYSFFFYRIYGLTASYTYSTPYIWSKDRLEDQISDTYMHYTWLPYNKLY